MEKTVKPNPNPRSKWLNINLGRLGARMLYADFYALDRFDIGLFSRKTRQVRQMEFYICYKSFGLFSVN